MMTKKFFALLALILYPTFAVEAATLSTSAVARNYNNLSGGGAPPQLVDADTSDASMDKSVQSEISGSGLLATGEVWNTSSANSSVDYMTGELKVFAEAETTTGVQSGFNSGGQGAARLQDQLTFTVDPSATSRDVTFLWFVEYDIAGIANVTTDLNIQDADIRTGGALVTLSETFTESGSSLFEFIVTLPEFPSSSTSLLNIDLRLRANAQTRIESAGIVTESLADASNTGVLNILTPDGITFFGSESGLLSEMRIIGGNGTSEIPVPPALPLLGAGLLSLGLLSRRSKRLRASKDQS